MLLNVVFVGVAPINVLNTVAYPWQNNRYTKTCYALPSQGHPPPLGILDDGSGGPT